MLFASFEKWWENFAFGKVSTKYRVHTHTHTYTHRYIYSCLFSERTALFLPDVYLSVRVFFSPRFPPRLGLAFVLLALCSSAGRWFVLTSYQYTVRYVTMEDRWCVSHRRQSVDMVEPFVRVNSYYVIIITDCQFLARRTLMHAWC